MAELQDQGILKYSIAYLFIVLLLASCRSDPQTREEEMPLLYPAPDSYAFNPEAGYDLNPVTGNKIQALLNSTGDTLQTGVPVPASGRTIDPDLVAAPKTIRAGTPQSSFVRLNVQELPEELPQVPVNIKTLPAFSPGENASASVLVNSTGDTVRTGIPLPMAGRAGPCLQPKPLRAPPPGKKDIANIAMKYVDVDQGMNSSHVLSLLEDRHGNMWIGTGGGGVSRYTGNTFFHFTEKEGLGSNIVWSVMEDVQGNLWFATYGGGVTRYDGENFTHFTEEEGLADNHVRSMMEDSRGNLWFGSWKGGASRYDGDTIIHFSKREGLSNLTINAMYEDSQGRIWFGTGGEGAIMFDGKTFTHFTETQDLGNNVVLSFLEDSRGMLWVGTAGGGVVRYDGKYITRFTEKEGLSSNWVRSIVEDRQGNLWFGTETGGVSLFDGRSFRHFTERDGLSNDAVNFILEDGRGNLWFATEFGGVSIYDGKSFTHFTREDGLTDPRIRSILEDSRGNIWFGPWNGGVSSYREGRIRHYTGTEGFSNDPVHTIYEDSRHHLWFGTGGGGVIRFDGSAFTHYTKNEGLSSNDVRSVLEDSQGNMWFGTWGGGVTRYDGHSFTHYTEKEGLCNNNVRSILEDSQGNLWFGTYGGGVSRLKGETITHFTEKDGLSNNVVLSLMEDSRGQLWLGTYGGGVNMLAGETVTHFTEREGLSNNIVQSVQEDSLGNVWVSTEKGLNLIVPAPEGPVAEGRPHRIWNYGLQDGLKATDFILNSALLDSQDRLWWGSSKSLTMLDMHHFEIPDNPPYLQLNSVVINDQFADYRHLKDAEGPEMEFSGVARFYNYPTGLVLPYRNNHLTFHFSAIDWSAPHRVKYSYRLEGLNDRWSLPSPESFADYRKLPHGEYTFKVRATGGAHRWSDILEYSFTISPPWWSTLWARIVFGLAGLMVVLSLIRWRTSYLMRQRKELEAKVTRATHQIREQKEEIESQRDEVLASNEALENQKKELQLTVENLKMTQSQLIQSEKMASVGVLTAGIAHELNNPINFVRGNVNPLKRDLSDLFQFIQKYDEILQAKQLDNVIGEVNELKGKLDFTLLHKEIMSLLEGIEEGASRSGQIVRGLRSFSRLDEESCQLYDIHEGIDSTLILLQNKLKNRIKVRKEYGDFNALECFPSKLNQVFLNVLNNSIQAIEGKGEIIIQTVKSGIGIKIIIKDTGKGMTPEVKKHIFDPFFTTKEVGEGTGLGLSISYGIIELHDGHIDVISEPGKGTEFIISLPLSQADKTPIS